MSRLPDSITALIPQRPPFVMIDELTWCDDQVARASFTVRDDHIFVENGRFTEPGLVENIAQTAAARAGYMAIQENRPVLVGYIGAVKNLVIHSLPFLNDILLTEVKVTAQVFDVTIITGEVRCNGVLLAACEMKIFISPSK